MTKDERTLNSYALRNAILLVLYGLYGILLLPWLYTTLFTESMQGWMSWGVQIVVFLRFISYVLIGLIGMLNPASVKKNHHFIK
jgi:hypothetical protein